jgi:hypothetical protein
MLPFLGTATSLGTNSSSKPLDFRGSFWNHTTVGFSDWFIQQVLQSGFDQLASRRLFRRQSRIVSGDAAAAALATSTSGKVALGRLTPRASSHPHRRWRSVAATPPSVHRNRAPAMNQIRE